MNTYLKSTNTILIENIKNIKDRVQDEVTSHREVIDDLEDFESIEDLQKYFYEFLAIMRTQGNILHIACIKLEEANGLINSSMTREEINKSLIDFRY